MATGDITSIAVSSSGVQVSFQIEGLDGSQITAFESGKSASLVVVSEGYNASGTLTTNSRSVETKFISASGSSPATVTLGLSDPIYDDDKNGGAGTSGTDPTITISAGAFNDGSNSSNAVTSVSVTNNSTLDYPKVIARWAMPPQIIFGSDYAEYFGFQSADGTTAYLEMDAFHYFGIACVKFTLTDGSNPQTSTQTAWSLTNENVPSWKTGGTRLYRAELDVTSMANGILTGDWQAYPAIGDADSIRDTTAGTWPTTMVTTPCSYKFWNNEGNSGTAITPVYAYHDVNAGGSGTASTTEATAQADPFPDLWDALDAAGAASKAFGNPTETGGDTASGVIIKCEEGSLTAGNYDTARVVTSNAWCIITRAAGTTKANVIFNTTPNASGLRTNRVMFHDVTFEQNASNLALVRAATNGAAGTDTSSGVWWKACNWIGNYSTTTNTTYPIVTAFNWLFFTDCTSSDTYNGFSGRAPFAVLARNCYCQDSDSDTYTNTRMVLDCEVRGSVSVSGAHPDVWQNNGLSGDVNAIVRDIRVLSHYNQTFFNNDNNANNIACVNALFERIGNPTGGFGQWLDANCDHILWWHITHVGQGYKWGDADNATSNAFSNHSIRNCFFSDAIINNDDGGYSALLNGNGFRDNHVRDTPNDMNSFGTNTTGDPLFTDDQSRDTTDAGGGNYQPASGSPLIVLTSPSQLIVLYDLFGVERTISTNSIGSIAAEGSGGGSGVTLDMSVHKQEVWEVIFDRVNNDSRLISSSGELTAIYHEKADPDALYPYAVFKWLPDQQDENINGFAYFAGFQIHLYVPLEPIETGIMSYNDGTTQHNPWRVSQEIIERFIGDWFERTDQDPTFGLARFYPTLTNPWFSTHLAWEGTSEPTIEDNIVHWVISFSMRINRDESATTY